MARFFAYLLQWFLIGLLMLSVPYAIAAQDISPAQIKKNTAELIKRAESGDAQSQYALGLVYRYGIGVTRDAVLASVWFRKAAEQGNADAQYWLGVM